MILYYLTFELSKPKICSLIDQCDSMFLKWKVYFV